MKIAIIGCGRIFPKHLEAIRNFPEQLDLVGLCDVNPAKLSKLESELKVPTFTDISTMLKTVKPHLVSILTPSGMHPEHAILAARHGCHVIVEKPMALALADADEMIRVCDENAVKLFVVKQNRFNRPVQKLKTVFDQGKFGKVNLITVRVRWARDQAYYDSDSWRGTWSLDGGVIANQAAHHVDLLQWFGGDIVSVYASGATYGSIKMEAENTALAIIKFKSGAMGLIEATTATRPKNLEGSLSILGDRGTVVIGGTAVNKIETWSFVDSTPDDLEIITKESDEVRDVYGKGHTPYYKNVIESLTDHGHALIDGLEGKKSLELISAFYESMETSSEVKLRFQPKQCKLGMR